MGLRKILDEAEVKRVCIVAAQCHGKYFSDALKLLTRNKPPSRQYDLLVDGLSYGDTWRVPGADTKISNVAIHFQLVAWIQVSTALTPR